MRLSLGRLPAAVLTGFLFAALSLASPFAQAQAGPQPAPASAPATAPAESGAQPAPPAQEQAPPVATQPAAAETASQPTPAAPARKTYTVPAGTKVLLQLRSAINTRSAKPGDGIYLSSTFPVVVGNRVMIPAGVYVQGVVDRVVRAGRVKGKSQLDMHFTSMIFPNGTVVEIPGVVNSIPGAKNQSVANNDEGTIQQDSDKTRNAGKVAEVSIPTGATIGSIGGLGAGHPVEGGLIGLGGGLAAVGIATLFTRGADVNIESGSQVEMVLQRPLLLEEENLSPNSGNGPGSAPALVPAANQPKPMEKPVHRRLGCPLGGIGCE